MSELTVASRMRDALAQAADQLIDIGIGLLSIVLVILLARLLIHFLRRFFWRQSGLKQLEPDAMTLIDNGISFLVYFAAVTVLLALWGASWSTLLTAISISTLAAVLGLQDLLKSILGGVFVILDQPYSVGDHILLDAAEGEIMAVHLRTTIIRSADGHQISLPNSIVLTTALHNFDRVLESDTVVRVSGVRASRDLTQARLESLLSEEPAIAGKVIVALTAPPRARTLFTRWRTPSTHQSAVERDATADLHITLLLPQPPGSHPSEDEAVRRLRAEFPDASLTVRHGSTRQ